MSAMRQAFTLEQSVDHGSTRREHGRQALNKEKFRISRPSARHTGEGGGPIPQITPYGVWVVVARAWFVCLFGRIVLLRHSNKLECAQLRHTRAVHTNHASLIPLDRSEVSCTSKTTEPPLRVTSPPIAMGRNGVTHRSAPPS
jgi:hypothetical protein